MVHYMVKPIFLIAEEETTAFYPNNSRHALSRDIDSVRLQPVLNDHLR